ncbi:MAG: transglycosylase domain-containing protein [Bacteroidetes bacterium]|nr:transglycosylase domain-containing protein [Bacteroidota bacterium]
MTAFEQRYHTQIAIHLADFKGLNGLLIKGVTLAPQASDTLLQIDSVFLNIRLFPLLTGKVRFSNLEIANTYLHIIKSSNRNNFSFLIQQKKDKQDSVIVKADYSRYAEKMLSTLFDAIPSSVRFKNTIVSFEGDSIEMKANVPKLEIKDHVFSTQIILLENNVAQRWLAEGSIFSDERTADLKLFPQEKGGTFLPLLKQKWKLSLTFDTIQMKLDRASYENNSLLLSGRISAKNFQLNHWRVSANNVIIQNQTLDYLLRIGTNFVELDSTSTVSYNKVKYHPCLSYQIYPTHKIKLDVSLPECSAQDFFESFPKGLFENIDGIKTSGSLSYKLHFFIDTKYPNELEFSSSLSKKNFKILGFGNTNLAKMNGEFQYTAYEKDRAVRSFSVGTSNPYYTPINEISTSMKAALLTSEDGNFYSHSGFNEDAFRKSIATNFKEKRFVRGGSTISMQLVKNVFLTRNKTIARKMEEAMLVWLIENNRLVSKERMYEVYLNIIEWGPNVYGIGEASRFYFEKKPSELSLAESIFLAMIVPRPKGFKYNFGPDGKLKESVASYYSLVAGHMVRKGALTEQEKSELVPNVILKGFAKSMVLVSDTIQIQEEQEDIF